MFFPKYSKGFRLLKSSLYQFNYKKSSINAI